MDITHGLEIETTAEALFRALTTDDGIAAWWTKAHTREGGSLELAFGAGAVTFRVDKPGPGQPITWVADQVPSDWNGTKVIFEPSEGTRGGSIRLQFRHAGFERMTPVVAFSSYAWAQFLRSLKLYLETDQGEPFGSPASLAAGTTPRR